MSPRPHRVNPRQPARTGRGNRDDYLRGYAKGLASTKTPPWSSASGGGGGRVPFGGGRSGKGCLVAVLALPALPAAMSAIALIARSA